MKNFSKTILSASLLMCFALSASAQVTQIWNNDGSLHKVKIDNDKLFVITSTGVYEQNLDESGNLSGNGFELSKLFDNFGYEVIDFIQNGDQIIVITNNNILANGTGENVSMPNRDSFSISFCFSLFFCKNIIQISL